MKTKNKGFLSIIILIFFGLILLNLISNVLTENIPEEFSDFLKTFPEETLGLEYKWFWSISTVSVMLLLLFLTWRTHLFTAKEQASEPNLNNIPKINTKPKNRRRHPP
jgi:ABC-type sulfate transport system permease component